VLEDSVLSEVLKNTTEIRETRQLAGPYQEKWSLPLFCKIWQVSQFNRQFSTEGA